MQQLYEEDRRKDYMLEEFKLNSKMK